LANVGGGAPLNANVEAVEKGMRREELDQLAAKKIIQKAVD